MDVHELPSGRTARIANTAAGFKDLAAWISPETGCVAYESTGRWHRAMEEALAATQPLACVNPARARRFAQALGQEAKTDAVDARVLAMMAAAIKLRRVEQSSPVQRDLEELNTARDALMRDRTATLNRSKHLRHKLLRRQNKLRLAQIERQIKALDMEIRSLVGDDDDLSRKVQILTSIPGVAQITAVGLLAGMPELGRLDGRAAASLAGLAPFTRESGKWKGYSFIGGGRRRVRQALYMASLSAINCNPDLARQYQALRSRGKPGKVALAAIMRRMLVLANVLITEDRAWQAVPPRASA